MLTGFASLRDPRHIRSSDSLALRRRPPSRHRYTFFRAYIETRFSAYCSPPSFPSLPNTASIR
ncbi:hypothetical protein B0H12DRAFT_1100455 [Mycena haematopus]|nr:hypothetical protein B0H12DRAFT_1100455 [Mycena haematopus]